MTGDDGRSDRCLIVTGATGFLGRHLIEAMHREMPIVALSRGSPTLRGFSLPASARWTQLDIAVAADVRAVFDAVARERPVEAVFHLASHYDFTGDRDPEYQRTNVDGTRNVLEAATSIGARDVFFASSIAACRFPARGTRLRESSPPDGDTPYAASKRAGEAMVRQYRGATRTWIVRFAALFSDFCEYEPLYRFVETWLSRTPRSRFLAGRGRSAIPFLHVRDAVAFLRAVLHRRETLDPDRVLLASPDGATSHLELFEAATAAHFGERSRALHVPGTVCRPALHVRDAVGRAIGLRAFERPWMGRMIDLRLEVDAGETRERLEWAPRPRLSILRRMPFLIQNRKALTTEWHRRNHGALRSTRRHENLQVHRALERRIRPIADTVASHVLDPERAARFPTLRALGRERQRSDQELVLTALLDAVRTGEKSIFQRACRILARRRQADGLAAEELVAALHVLNDAAVLHLAGDGDGHRWSLALYDHVTMTVQFGIDEIHDAFEGGS